MALANALPCNIKFGASSWSSDGWAGDVYHRSYRDKGPTTRLEEYVRYPLFRLVGINTAFYEPPRTDPRRLRPPAAARVRL